MNVDTNRQGMSSIKLNIQKQLEIQHSETGRSSSSQALVGMNKQIVGNHQESLSPISKKVNYTNSNVRKSDQIKKEGANLFAQRKLELDDIGNYTQNLKTSIQYEGNNVNSKSSVNLKKGLEENSDFIHQFRNLKIKLQQNGFSKIDAQNLQQQPSSSLRFVLKDKGDKKDQNPASKPNNHPLQKDNTQLRKSDMIRHKRNLSNQNHEANNTQDADQNIKRFFAKVNGKVEDNGSGNQVRKCISSREIYIPNISNPQQQGSALHSQEILNPLKIQAQQMSHFQSSRNQDNNKWFSPNNTPLKKTKYDQDKSQNQQQQQQHQQNLSRIYTSVQSTKSPKNRDFTASPSVSTAYKQYMNKIMQKQQQVYDKYNQISQIESPQSINTPTDILGGFNSLRGSQSSHLLNQNKQQDHNQKKSVMQNIFLKDKDQVNLEDINFRQKKLDPLNQSNGNIELPRLMYPASKKELAEFQMLQEQNELRFSRANKQMNNEADEFQGSSHQNNNSINEEKNLKNLRNLKSCSNFFKDNKDSMRITELVKERNESIKQQKIKQQESQTQLEQKLSSNFSNLIQENIKSRFFSNSPSKLLVKSKTKESQAIIITDVSEITKSRHLYQSSNNISSQNQISPSRGSQKLISSITKLGKAQVNQGESIPHTPSATFSSKFTFRKLRRQLTKGSPTLRSIGSNLVEEYEDQIQSSIILKKQQQYEKELARETHLVDYLQQKKIFVREALQQFLKERQRIVKNITRNCLMDSEQFVFFIMNFLQFCIDDMFQEFKKNYSLKLAQINETGDKTGQISSIFNSQSETDAVSFKFSQKIPEDIMKQVVEVIINCLENQAQDLKITSLERLSDNNMDESKPQKKKSIDQHLDDYDRSYLIDEGLDKFYNKVQRNVEKYIHPQTLIDRLGGFARLRLLIVAGVKTFNNYINSASKMMYIEEDDEELIDKYLMSGFCALVNEDKETLQMLVSIFKSHKNYLSHYDFFTIKKITWDTLSSIKLDPKLKNFVILQLENIRYEFFDHPFERRLKELAQSMMKSYELCNYFRNPCSSDNAIFLSSLFPVLYKNSPYNDFYQANQQRLKFALNDRFFDHLQKFLLDELKETDTKSILDLQIRVAKLRIRAGVAFNFFSIINEDSETFFNQIFPFLSSWIQKYNLQQMDSKAQDFKFLELFIKWSLNKQDYYSIMDSEPCLMHYVVNEFMIQFWIKGIAAYFEDNQVSKSQYSHLISFLSQYLLFKREENTQKSYQIPLDLSPSKIKH